MAGETFRDVLESWLGQEVTIVNPESFKSTALGKGLTFQSYKVTLTELGEDVLKMQFSSIKGESKTAVEQIVPIRSVKRLSLWGDEKLLHL